MTENTTVRSVQPAISIVIPTFERAKTLEKLVNQIAYHIPQGVDFEIILVDDASRDDSRIWLKQLAADCDFVKVIVLKQRVGQQNATLAGLRAARGTLIVTMDDDFKDRPSDLVRLIEPLSQGFDLVYAVPTGQTGGRLRRRGTAFKEWVINRLISQRQPFQLTAFRAMTAACADLARQDRRRRIYISASILQHPVKVTALEVANAGFERRPSRYSLFHLARVLSDLVIYYGPLGRLKGQKGTQYEIEEVYE